MTNIESKLASLKAVVEKKSGNKNPDYYKSLKEYRLLSYIYGLQEVGISAELEEWFQDYISNDAGGKPLVHVQKGDTLMGLIAKYPDTKDIVNKIKKACDKAGLTLNMATGMVE